MVRNRFRFLSDDEFEFLDQRARVAYLFRAQQEVTERERVLLDQLRRTVGKPADPPAALA
jgi:hypothetical protein